MPEHGVIIIGSLEHDKQQEAKTIQCCHCGGHYVPQPGSRTVRGFCQNCNGFVCGPGCAECIPWEKQLEIIEGSRRLDQVSVGWNG